MRHPNAGAKVYANGKEMKDPLLSPVYGDMTSFPPTILTSGTRDLLLSNAVRVHRKLRQAGAEAALQVYEGPSHAHYLRDDSAAEDQVVLLGPRVEGLRVIPRGSPHGYGQVSATEAGLVNSEKNTFQLSV